MILQNNITMVTVIGLTVLVLVFLMISVFFVSVVFHALRGDPDAPAIPLPKESLESLLGILAINDKDIVYDLGCGDGRVIAALYSVIRRGYFIGIERNIVVYCLAYLRVKFFTKKHASATIKIVYGDIFKQDLSTATHVIVYLFPSVLGALLPKFKTELKQGVLVYSVSFAFKGIKPKKIIQLRKNKTHLAQEVYVYEF